MEQAIPQQTRLEEALNSGTHFIGLLMAITGLVYGVLVASASGDPYLIAGCAIFGVSMILLYLSSFLYHLTYDPKWKRVFLKMDLISIYLLIAGTYAPFLLGPLRESMGHWALWLCGVVFAMALAGTIRELVIEARCDKLGSFLYLAMGWLAMIFIVPLFSTMSFQGFLLLLLGGLIYSLGVIFFLMQRMKYHHVIWHFFVIGGSVSHYFAMLTILQ